MRAALLNKVIISTCLIPTHTEIDYTVSILPMLKDSLTNEHPWFLTSVPKGPIDQEDSPINTN